MGIYCDMYKKLAFLLGDKEEAQSSRAFKKFA